MASRFNGTADTRFVSKTATFTLDPKAGEVFLVDATAGAVTVNLPSVTDAEVYMGGIAKPITIKKIDVSANAVTLDGLGSETIDGAATKSLGTQWFSYTIASNGTAWFIIAELD